jgi:hypothetical protein
MIILSQATIQGNYEYRKDEYCSKTEFLQDRPSQNGVVGNFCHNRKEKLNSEFWLEFFLIFEDFSGDADISGSWILITYKNRKVFRIECFGDILKLIPLNQKFYKVRQFFHRIGKTS